LLLPNSIFRRYSSFEAYAVHWVGAPPGVGWATATLFFTMTRESLRSLLRSLLGTSFAYQPASLFLGSHLLATSSLFTQCIQLLDFRGIASSRRISFYLVSLIRLVE